MKRIKRFNEDLEINPTQVSDKAEASYGVTYDKVEKFSEFSLNRYEGAKKIAANAEEKGGDALLTYHHFQVKLPYYQQAADGKFNTRIAKSHYEDLIDELVEKTGNGMSIEQIEFQELVGRIEVIGELLIKNKEL